MCERIPHGRRPACNTRNRRDKTVAAARHIGHIACVRSPLPKRLPQHQDMIATTAVIDHKVQPHFCDQLLLADHFGRTFDQNDKNVESATAKLNRLAAFFFKSLPLAYAKPTTTNPP